MTTKNLEELLTRRVQNILPSKAALATLLTSRKIKLYQGFDPSNPNLHLGHLVGLLQLKAFQDLGHEVIFLIGDFTGMIGDPTDKTSSRPKLTRNQIIKNAATYKNQAGKILRFDGKNPAKMLFNYDWLSRLSFADLIEITSNLTVQQLIERDMFQTRLQKQAPIFLHEFLYPVAQGYDSVHLEVDLEVGGQDQMFNLLVGRQLMKAMRGKEKFCLTTKLLTDADGRKIGKTTGNAINLFNDPHDLYGSIMSQPDSILDQGFELVTTLPLTEIVKLKNQSSSDPMTVKKRLAYEVVKLCHGDGLAQSAEAQFASLFQKNPLNAVEIPVVKLNLKPPFNLMDLLKQLPLSASNSQLKRLIVDGGVELDGQKIRDPQAVLNLNPKTILKYGKHQFFKLDF